MKIIEVNDNKDYSSLKQLRHVSRSSLFKFDIAEILSKHDKVLYLDSDVLILDNLEKLYNINFENNYAVVVKDTLSMTNPTHVKKVSPKIDFYFNTGVMLLNLEKMRKDKISNKLLSFRKNKFNKFMDQDAFNAIFNNDVIYANIKYNFLNAYLNYSTITEIENFYNEKFSSNECELYENAKILHLGGLEKPWSTMMGSLTYIYLKYSKYYSIEITKNIQELINKKMEKINFDKSYYLNKYPHIKKVGMDPIEHYIKYGEKEGKYPNKNAEFNSIRRKINNTIELEKSQNEDSNISFRNNNKNPIKYTTINHPNIVEKLKNKLPPKISVIIPVYNAENYLNKCLDSVINQSLKNFEIICINDGSTDNSLKILKEYANKDKRIKIINQENKGAGAARNKGLNTAKGEYIEFVDSDDWLENNTLDYLYSLAKNKNTDIIMFKLRPWNDKENKFFKRNDYELSALKKYFNHELYSHHEIKEELFNISVSPCNKFYKKDFLDNIHAKFPEGTIFEDNPFFFQVILNFKKLFIIDKYLYNRRVRENSVITSKDERYFGYIPIMNHVIETFKENKVYEEYETKLLNHKISSIKYFAYKNIDEDSYLIIFFLYVLFFFFGIFIYV
ncbi:putative glycosyltransferase EpsH [Methanobrevibacter filiformis]|uniref:Putative glycosyltransferase EpsH n=1 Tax=Methanobrevibacter filiformis TaxID=55758 RepID=A0A166CSW1_9EURY|nr:putative glycosyltransferase EpsH [Methanobrevibacter filiformis]